MKPRPMMCGAVSVLALSCLTGCLDIREGSDATVEAPLVSPTAAATKSQTPVPSPLAAMEAESRRLFFIAASGEGDAEAEAKRSMDRGDFRFFGYSFLVPGINHAAYGVECEPSVFSRPALVGPLFARSDVIHEYEEQIVPEANFRRFGSTYNAIILADPRFPLRRECSAVPVGDLRERPAEYRYPGRR